MRFAGLPSLSLGTQAVFIEGDNYSFDEDEHRTGTVIEGDNFPFFPSV